MRVLGAKLEVVGDETRATPKPGETGQGQLRHRVPDAEGLDQELADDADQLHRADALHRRHPDLPGVPRRRQGRRQIGRAERAGDGRSERKLRCSDLLGRARRERRRRGCSARPATPAPTLNVRKNFSAARMLFLGVFCEKGTPLIDVDDPALFSCEHNSGETVRLNGLITDSARQGRGQPQPEPRRPRRSMMDRVDHRAVARAGRAAAGRQRLRARRERRSDQAAGARCRYADPGTHKLLLSYDAAAREKDDGEPKSSSSRSTRPPARWSGASRCGPGRPDRRTASSRPTSTGTRPSAEKLPEARQARALLHHAARSARRLRLRRARRLRALKRARACAAEAFRARAGTCARCPKKGGSMQPTGDVAKLGVATRPPIGSAPELFSQPNEFIEYLR